MIHIDNNDDDGDNPSDECKNKMHVLIMHIRMSTRIGRRSLLPCVSALPNAPGMLLVPDRDRGKRRPFVKEFGSYASRKLATAWTALYVFHHSLTSTRPPKQMLCELHLWCLGTCNIW
jgi:hypothetical protein